MRYLFFSLLVISAIGLFAVPQAFADHDEVTIQNALFWIIILTVITAIGIGGLTLYMHIAETLNGYFR